VKFEDESSLKEIFSLREFKGEGNKSSFAPKKVWAPFGLKKPFESSQKRVKNFIAPLPKRESP